MASTQVKSLSIGGSYSGKQTRWINEPETGNLHYTVSDFLAMELVFVKSSYTFTLLTVNTWLRLYLSPDEKRSNHYICIYSSQSDNIH